MAPHRHPWLRRLNHDLVKRLLWPARDRRDMGGEPVPGELLPALVDDEGGPISVEELWQRLRADAPDDLKLDRFSAALLGAIESARHGDVPGVLALETAFADLARTLEGM